MEWKRNICILVVGNVLRYPFYLIWFDLALAGSLSHPVDYLVYTGYNWMCAKDQWFKTEENRRKFKRCIFGVTLYKITQRWSFAGSWARKVDYGLFQGLLKSKEACTISMMPSIKVKLLISEKYWFLKDPWSWWAY